MSIASKLRQGAKLMTDWRLWPFYLQRRVMRADRRRQIARVLTRIRPVAAHTRADPEADALASLVREEGLAHLGTLLDAGQCARLRDYFAALPVHDLYRPEAGTYLPLSDERHSHSHVSFHHAADVVKAPGLWELANDERILGVVERLLGCRPTIGYMAAWWSYATELGAQQAENFHRDVDDWAFYKLFVYLTDVDEDAGPHVYVRNSAADPRLARISRFSDEEVGAHFGGNQVTMLTGNAGEGFLEDTFGIHKGQPVQNGHRLMFQVVYSMFPLPYGPRTPPLRRSELADPSFADPWINRLYVSD